jgi:hypothetical protein
MHHTISYAHAEHTHQYPQCKHKFLMYMLSARISSLGVCSQHVLKGPLHSARIGNDAYAQCTDLSARISS